MMDFTAGRNILNRQEFATQIQSVYLKYLKPHHGDPYEQRYYA
jgi:hypothetical protein